MLDKSAQISRPEGGGTPELILPTIRNVKESGSAAMDGYERPALSWPPPRVKTQDPAPDKFKEFVDVFEVEATGEILSD
jgi:hypothetical protein